MLLIYEDILCPSCVRGCVFRLAQEYTQLFMPGALVSDAIAMVTYIIIIIIIIIITLLYSSNKHSQLHEQTLFTDSASNCTSSCNVSCIHSMRSSNRELSSVETTSFCNSPIGRHPEPFLTTIHGLSVSK